MRIRYDPVTVIESFAAKVSLGVMSGKAPQSDDLKSGDLLVS